MAQYVSGTDRNQTMLLPASVEDYIAPDSEIRALDAFVDGLDLAGLGFDVRGADAAGRSSYDPAALLKLYLWGYLRRSRSSRKLEEACATNLEAIWLTGNIRPDHSTVSDFRKRHAAPLKGTFRDFNLTCVELELFGRELVAIDGTFIKAVNSRARSYTRAKLEKLIATIDKAAEGYLEKLDLTDAADREVNTAGAGSDAAALREKIEGLRARRAELRDHQERCARSATGQLSLTDPDSVQLKKNGKRTVGYNVQAAVDGKHHLVAGAEVTQDGNDMAQLDAMAQRAKEGMGLPPEAPIKALADAGYGVGAELAACEANNTETYVPVQKSKGETGELYKAGDFTRDAGADTYRCPAGETLRRAADKHNPGKQAAVLHTYENRGACRACPLRERCTKGEFRRLLVSEHRPAVDGARERLAREPGSMRRRAAIAEHPFATLKERNGRYDLLCRGLELAGAEVALGFWWYNFTRAMNILGARELIRAMRQRAASRVAA